MDRSYWSHPEIIAAARDFVCIRLVTYEDAEEGAFVQSIFRGREGTLENSIFALLAPDGETLLARAGRSPSMVFGGESEELKRSILLQELRKAAKPYKAKAKGIHDLPLGLDLRRMMNVAACDLQPLVILYGASQQERTELKSLIANLAWADAYRGQFAFSWAQGALEMKAMTGLDVDVEKSQIWVVAPNEFGTSASLLAGSSVTSATSVEACLQKALQEFRIENRDAKQHIRKGRREGVLWQSQFPNTDPMVPSRRK